MDLSDQSPSTINNPGQELIRQFVIYAENKVGWLNDFISMLKSQDIHVMAISVLDTTDSAVRITHIPTGLVVTSQDEKSQLKNKNQAMRILRSRLLKTRQDEAAAERAKDRKEQVGSGERSDKIRTYNYKDNRVSDHRINLTIKRLEQVLDGDLEDFVNALIADHETARLANLEE